MSRTYTHPDVLSKGITEGWADPEDDPTTLDWPARQAAAAIPFEVVDGRPLNPHHPTGIRYGRSELGHWGEQQAADALVAAFDENGRRWIVLIERRDEVERYELCRWALPGGKVDSGETALEAAVRELAEETGLDLRGQNIEWHAGMPQYVDDPRASDEAWMVTTLCIADLGVIPRGQFPAVAGGDDAARAAWVPADTYGELTYHLTTVYRCGVWSAHVDMLAHALRNPNGD
ncbi:hypothetical protein BJF79_03480 [Actinomadura sp. CNU-125]|uniref:NUDIX domain-containing protein n=1 Tax=Actinomadura sp. CNU-125 TaxID=1904961 RepID=UPI00095AC26E|nr:NUDIX domain-containing protein [Actinomadura sp. CNU-125]OLT12975.1 hypothetical protein BJF79_03480 [Actinomadura sp. CNU-125]